MKKTTSLDAEEIIARRRRFLHHLTIGNQKDLGYIITHYSVQTWIGPSHLKMDSSLDKDLGYIITLQGTLIPSRYYYRDACQSARGA